MGENVEKIWRKTLPIFALQFRGTLAASGKKKAHKHKYFWPVTPPASGGVSRPGGQGSKFYVLSSEPKEHKSFCPDTRQGGPVTGATEKSFMCKSCKGNSRERNSCEIFRRHGRKMQRNFGEKCLPIFAL